MVARVRTVAFHGVEVIEVETQVTIASGLPAFTVVGLPDKAVAESRERVRAALGALGLALPPRRITVNLAPADVLKEGSHFDLPIALGLLAEMEVLPQDELAGYTALGEVSLDGSLTRVPGVLLAALTAAARDSGIICPVDCGGEAAWAGDVEIIAAPSLLAIVNHFKGTQLLPPPAAKLAPSRAAGLDLKDVKGQESAKRALEIAASGGHNLLMVGPPGTGKSMLAARLPGILPPLTRTESLETTRIYSAMGLLPDGVALMDQRPVRTPHHSATAQALVGGGSIPRPGEVSLAHHGVLFLDELPEFSRYVLEMLRQPLEGGEVTVARVHGSVKFPAKFMLVAGMNPTRSGYDSSDPRAREKYLSKLSGPLLDRIDIHVEVPTVPYRELTGKHQGTTSAQMSQQVRRARAAQRKRFGNDTTNARMDTKQLRAHAELSDSCLLLMKQAMDELGLSARAYDKVRRVARTIADIDGVEKIAENHLAEAVQYRLLDRRL